MPSSSAKQLVLTCSGFDGEHGLSVWLLPPPALRDRKPHSSQLFCFDRDVRRVWYMLPQPFSLSCRPNAHRRAWPQTWRALACMQEFKPPSLSHDVRCTRFIWSREDARWTHCWGLSLTHTIFDFVHTAPSDRCRFLVTHLEEAKGGRQKAPSRQGQVCRTAVLER